MLETSKIIPVERIESRILLIRRRKVMQPPEPKKKGRMGFCERLQFYEGRVNRQKARVKSMRL